MKKRDILKEPTLKLALTNQLLNKDDYYSDLITPPPLSKIILVRYNNQEIKRLQLSEGSHLFHNSDIGGGYSQNTLTQPNHQNLQGDEASTQPEFYYRASDGFQQVDVLMQLSDEKKLRLFNTKQSFETHNSSIMNDKRPIICLFTVLTQYEFLITSPQQPSDKQGQEVSASRRQVQLIIKDFFIHSLQERLTSDVLRPPEQEDLPHLQRDQEIITFYEYLGHCELKKKAQRLRSAMPDFKFDVALDLLPVAKEDKGIEPILTAQEQEERRLAYLRQQVKLEPQGEIAEPVPERIQQRAKFDHPQVKLEHSEAKCDMHQESSESEEALVQTESEEMEQDEYAQEHEGNDAFNSKIHKRIKQLLGANFTKIKVEPGEKPEKIKSGRGKWHYACDQKYGFNVSYSNGDTIISMGQVFIIQTPKVSISSKYRGYPIPVIEPPRTAFHDEQDSRIPRFRTSDSRFTLSDKTEYLITNPKPSATPLDRPIDLDTEDLRVDDHIDLVSDSGNNNITSQAPQDADCCLTKGPVFNVYSYLTRKEAERQRGFAIQDGLKYEEEYLAHQLKQNAVRALNARQKQQREANEQARQQTGFFSDNPNQLNFEEPGKNFLHQALDECKREYESHEFMAMNDDIIRTYDENEESYISDNYHQYGLDSLKTPTSNMMVTEASKTKNLGFPFGGGAHSRQLNTDHIKQEDSFSEVNSTPYLTLPHYPPPRTLTAKSCSFFVDSKYFGHSEALKKGFKIKNTLMKVFKYGTKDFFRFSNAHLIEKFDGLEDTLKVLREEPQVYGNQKRKRMLKYFDRVTKLIKRIPKAAPPHSQERKEPMDPAMLKGQQDLDKINQGLNRTEIQKFMSWCKYKYERSMFHCQTKELVPLQYKAGNFFSINHNFNMRLQINVERSKSQANASSQAHNLSQVSQAKEESSKGKGNMQAKELKKPQIWPEDRRINIIPAKDSEKQKSSVSIPPKKVDVEIPLFSQNKLTGSQTSATAHNSSIQKSRVSLSGIGNVVSLPSLNTSLDTRQKDHQQNKPLGTLRFRAMSDDASEEEALLRDFCESDKRQEISMADPYLQGGSTQENQLLLDFDQGPPSQRGGVTQGLGFFSQTGCTQPGGGGFQTSQCDFTVQLSENDDEAGGERRNNALHESIDDSESGCTYDILAPRQTFSQSNRSLPVGTSCFNRAMYI